MDIELRHIEAMQKMQDIDLQRIRAEKELRELPQRGKIVAVREKRTALSEKRATAAALQKDKRAECTRVRDEDARLAQKADAVQETIAAAKGDYRMVESRSKELDGIAKRRETLAGELAALDAALSEIGGIVDRIDEALASLEAAEEQLVAAFRRDGGALQDRIARCKAARKILAETLPAEALDAYEKAAKRCGGVAMATLQEGGRCSACRSSFDDSHLQALRAQRPVGLCPSCRRLIVLED